MGADLKKDVLAVLTPIFGEKVRQTVDKFYENEDAELITMTRDILSDYMGYERTRNIMKDLLDKHPMMKAQLEG